MTFPPQAVESDSLRAALRAVFAGREYRWSEPSSAWLWLKELWQRTADWFAWLHVTSPVVYYALLGFLTVTLVGILVHIGWLVSRSLRPGEVIRPPAPTAGPARDAAWHAAEARRLGESGRFAEALGHRFLAAVLDLDDRRLVQFRPSKTPAEYASEARLDEPGRTRLAELVASLYRHVFGGEPCDVAEWRRFDALAETLGAYAAAR